MATKVQSPRVTTTVRLDIGLYEKLQEIAAKEVRTANNLIEYALTKFIEEYQSSNSAQN